MNRVTRITTRRDLERGGEPIEGMAVFTIEIVVIPVRADVRRSGGVEG